MNKLKALFVGAILIIGLAFGYSVFSTVNITDDINVSGTGLVGHWSFNGSDIVNSTSTDTSGEGNDGTIVGAVPVAGQLGQALEFDGVDDLVSVVDSASLDITEAITIEAWIYPIGWGENSTGRIVDKGSASAYSLYVSGISGYNKLFFSSSNAGVAQGSDDNSIELNKWQHVIITYDKANVRFYVNGVAKGGGVETASLGTNNYTLNIGNKSDTSRTFNGSIDEVRIYNRALSADEILDHYKQGAKKFNIDLQKGLVGHWDLSQENYNTTTKRFTDYSGSSNHGTSSNAVNFTTDRMGQAGNGMEFDGTNDYVDCGNDASLDITEEITCSGWINLDTVSNEYMVVVDKRVDNARQYQFMTAYDEIGFNFHDGDSWRTTKTDNANLIINKWYHFGIVYDDNANNVRFYLDGVLSATKTETSSLISNSANVVIGSRYDHNTDEFNGTIDEVKIYNRALGADEIKRNYDQYKSKYILD